MVPNKGICCLRLSACHDATVHGDYPLPANLAFHPKLIMVVYPKVLFKGGKSTEQTTGETAHVVSVEPPTSTTVELQECDVATLTDIFRTTH